ncbi:MAG: hypothetical protein ACI39T_01465 [Candidatus Cryptobacteroides sp.]
MTAQESLKLTSGKPRSREGLVAFAAGKAEKPRSEERLVAFGARDGR